MVASANFADVRCSIAGRVGDFSTRVGRADNHAPRGVDHNRVGVPLDRLDAHRVAARTQRIEGFSEPITLDDKYIGEPGVV